MITRNVGGELVKGGIYWSRGDGEFVSVPEGGGTLLGGPEDRYFRAPVPLVLAAGALMGLAFIILLPLSGLLVLLPFLGAKLRDAISGGRLALAEAHLQPGVSYLEGGGSSKDDSKAAGEIFKEGSLVELAREIVEKRWPER